MYTHEKNKIQSQTWRDKQNQKMYGQTLFSKIVTIQKGFKNENE